MSQQKNDKERLIALSEASNLYGFDQRYLAQLAQRGRLEAQKIGMIWVTTPIAMETYIRSRKKIGVYREDISVDQ